MENFVLPLWWMSMTNEMRPANCWTECEHAKHARSLPCPDDSLYLTDWTDTEIITREHGTWWGISVHKHTETVRYGLWRVPFCRYTGRRRRDCTRSLSFCALSGHLNINVFSWDGMRSAWLCGRGTCAAQPNIMLAFILYLLLGSSDTSSSFSEHHILYLCHILFVIQSSNNNVF